MSSRRARRILKPIFSGLPHMEEYKRTLEEKKMQDTEEDAVTLSTLHGSKGLEFDQVFILDVNEDTIPHRKAVLEAGHRGRETPFSTWE